MDPEIHDLSKLPQLIHTGHPMVILKDERLSKLKKD